MQADRTKTNHLAGGGGLVLENSKERIASTTKANELHRQRELAVKQITPVALNWVSKKPMMR